MREKTRREHHTELAERYRGARRKGARDKIACQGQP